MQKKKSKKKKILLIVLAVLLIPIAAIAVTLVVLIGNGNIGETADVIKTVATDSGKTGSETIVLFGVDSRDNKLGKGTRSDSIMVANVNHDTKKVRVASIYRDTYVDIDGHGLDKLTHAHAYGGPVFAMDTVNRNFDLDIKNYVTVNFGNVAKVVDQLGGIELDITEEELQYINGLIDNINRIDNTNSSHITTTGTQHVDGTQAVAYSRIRYTAGGDYRRAERQRTVLYQIFQKAKQENASNLIKIANQMMDQVATNYSTGDAIKVLSYLSKYSMEESKGFPNKLWGGTIDGVWYGVPVTLESNVTDLHKFLYEDEEYEPSDKVKEISSEIEKVASTPNVVLE
nr:LCP family protein [uncultured Anaerostipes sp.]